MAKYKHLTLSERIEIYTQLKANKSIRKIAKELKRDPTTISKEIKKHLEIRETGCGGRPFNQCKNSDQCVKTKVCGAEILYGILLQVQTNAISIVTNTKSQVCERLVKSPYCCDGCFKTRGCHYRKKFYRPATAQNEYKKQFV